MQFEGALVKEQGVTFAIVVVQSHVINSPTRETTRNNFSGVFPQVPIILMAQNSRGVPTYHGRTDIVKFLANTDMSRIPWKKFTI